MYRKEIPARVARTLELRRSGATLPRDPRRKGSRSSNRRNAIREQVA